MSGKTTIEWTNDTWNPVRGCSIVSPGCKHCYAMRQAIRHASKPGAPYHRLVRMSKAGPVWTGEVTMHPELLEWPLRRRKPRRIFVNSMSDLFHDAVSDDFIARVFATMAEAKQHTFQILTKRAERMRQLLKHDLPYEGPEWPLPNVWIGVSVEDQKRTYERIPPLLDTPAAVRWISAEPLLGPIELRDEPNDIGEPRFSYLKRVDGEGPRIDWVVAGGESGPKARPMHPVWARSLRDQCAAAGVPFHFKQWGNWLPEDQDESGRFEPDEQHLHFWPDVPRWASIHVGKKAAGRVLDGRIHDEYPA